jgi:hypothetical protein
MNVSMRGQILLLFAASLIVVVAMAGLLIDGGFLLSTQRQGQAAADTAALAAAQAANDGDDPIAAARAVATLNGFVDPLIDCDGASSPNEGVDVNQPPSSGPHAGSNDYVEVITTRAMRTAFAKAFGMPCFLVSARAVARISSSAVPTCNFCVLTKWGGDGSDNPFLMDNTGHLRVDGDILVNGKAITGSCSPSGAYTVCGKALHLYHTGGTPGDITHLSARTIALAGGWESLGGTQAKADVLAADDDGTPCDTHPDPNAYGPAGYPPSNVCVGMPPMDDPLALIEKPLGSNYARPEKGTDPCPNDGDDPDYPTVKVPTGSLGSPAKLSLTGGTSGGPYFTICPGLYFGGFSVVGNFSHVYVKMVPGVYFMVGGGFQVGGTAFIDGSEGVTIYNSGGSQSFSHSTAPYTGIVPTCTPGTPPPAAPQCKVLTAALTGPSSSNVEVPDLYTLTLTVPAGQPLPTGDVDFYDGDELIVVPNCEDVALTFVSATKVKATCTITYTEFGTRWITAIYSGDPVWKATDKDKQTTVNPNANLGIDDVDICTGSACGASAPCTQGGACTVVLHAPGPDGDYPGMLIFQDRTSSLGLRFWPHFGLDPCAGSGNPPPWMTAGVPGEPNEDEDVPQPCGALGGMSGTIYAPYSRTGTGWDAAVNLRADGVANLQVIAGRIALQYNTDARFAYDASQFAGGAIQLVE